MGIRMPQDKVWNYRPVNISKHVANALQWSPRFKGDLTRFKLNAASEKKGLNNVMVKANIGREKGE